MGRMQKSMDTLIGDQVDVINNGSMLSYTRPFDRGMLVDWGIEAEIWNRVFDADHLNIKEHSECNLVVTEPPLNPEELQNEMNEIVLEDYGFHAYSRKPAPWFCAYKHSKAQTQAQVASSSAEEDLNVSAAEGCMVVVDTGF